MTTITAALNQYIEQPIRYGLKASLNTSLRQVNSVSRFDSWIEKHYQDGNIQYCFAKARPYIAA